MAKTLADSETDGEDARKDLQSKAERELELRLYELGLLKESTGPITDLTPYQNRRPTDVGGQPVSETLLEDRG